MSRVSLTFSGPDVVATLNPETLEWESESKNAEHILRFLNYAVTLELTNPRTDLTTPVGDPYIKIGEYCWAMTKGVGAVLHLPDRSSTKDKGRIY